MLCGRGLLPFPGQPEGWPCPGATKAAMGAGGGLKPLVVPGGVVEATGEAARNRFTEEEGGLLRLVLVVVELD